MKKIVYVRSTSIVNDSRATKEIKSYISFGYEVIVLGWDRQGIVDDISFFGSKVKFLLFDEKSVYGSGIKNIFKLLSFCNWIKKKLCEYKDEFDIIHACDFDTAIACYKFSKKNNKKLIYDIYDYYSACHNLSFLRGIVEKVDISLINNSDCVILCTEQRKEQISKASPKKTVIIHNTPSIDIEPINHRGDIIKVCYVGILQDDRLLVEISNVLSGNEKYEFHVGGFGKYEEYFKDLSSKYKNVFFYGQMNYDDVLKLENKCDVLFATYNPCVPNHKFSAPNKVYEAMALGKPIIVCNNTGVDDLILREKIGYSIDYDAQQFLDVLDHISEKDFESINKRARELYLDKYSWDKMKQNLKDVIMYLEKR